MFRPATCWSGLVLNHFCWKEMEDDYNHDRNLKITSKFEYTAHCLQLFALLIDFFCLYFRAINVCKYTITKVNQSI